MLTLDASTAPTQAHSSSYRQWIPAQALNSQALVLVDLNTPTQPGTMRAMGHATLSAAALSGLRLVIQGFAGISRIDGNGDHAAVPRRG